MRYFPSYYGNDFNDFSRRQAISWACQTIAKMAPWFELVSKPNNKWDIVWKAEDGSEPIIHDEGENLDWQALVRFAKTL